MESNDCSYTALFITLCVAALALNIIQLALLLYSKRTKLPFDVTLINLAVSDIIAASAITVVTVLSIILPDRSFQYNYEWCLLVLYISCLSSGLLLVFIAFQRLFAVIYPLQFSVWFLRSRCIITICLIWAYAILIILPMLLNVHLYRRMLLFSPLFLSCAMILCYATLNYHTMKRRRLVAARPMANQNRRFYSIAITAVFVSCSLPFVIYAALNPHVKVYPAQMFYIYAALLIFNPLIYFLYHFWQGRKCLHCWSASRRGDNHV